MNREQKIALIVGFAVVLVVGVLVSDHLSGARKLEIAEATEGDAAVIEMGPVALLPTPGASHSLDVPSDFDTQRQVAPREVSGGAVTPIAPVEPDPVEMRLGASDGRQASPLAKFLDQSAARAEQDLATSDTTGGLGEAIRQFGSDLREGFESGITPTVELERSDRLTQGQATPELPRVGGEVREPERPVAQPLQHVVQDNESLFKIASRHLGDGNRWREIADANPGKVGKNGSIRAGVTLVIPGVRADTRTTRDASPALASPTSYTVKKNDSLSQISQRLLGSSKRMGEIIEANRGKIDDPDDIRIGMVLTIPARSGG